MKRIWTIAGVLASMLAAAPASAESLRCSGGIASEGDSRLSLIYKCGPPQAADTFCAAVVYGQTLNTVPDPIAAAYVPCVRTEELLYERGPGNLVAMVRIRSGVVQSIVYAQQPR